MAGKPNTLSVPLHRPSNHFGRALGDLCGACFLSRAFVQALGAWWFPQSLDGYPPTPYMAGWEIHHLLRWFTYWNREFLLPCKIARGSTRKGLNSWEPQIHGKNWLVNLWSIPISDAQGMLSSSNFIHISKHIRFKLLVHSLHAHQAAAIIGTVWTCDDKPLLFFPWFSPKFLDNPSVVFPQIEGGPWTMEPPQRWTGSFWSTRWTCSWS